MNCINRTFSRHFDIHSRATFVPLLLGGVFVGLARELDEEAVEALTGRDGFELYTDDELKALVDEEAQAVPDPTGDPVTDGASSLPTDYRELLKLAAARGINLGKTPKKVDLIAALSGSEAPAPPPPPPGS